MYLRTEVRTKSKDDKKDTFSVEHLQTSPYQSDLLRTFPFATQVYGGSRLSLTFFASIYYLNLIRVLILFMLIILSQIA